MLEAMKAATKAHRKAVEALYEGKATVTEHRKVTDPKTKLTTYKDVVVLDKQPCRLSFEKLSAAIPGEAAVSASQVTKLFISPDVTIKPGSKITVDQKDVTTDYTYSSVPAVHSTHQEIMLELFERWT